MGRAVSPNEIDLAEWIRPGDGVIWGQATAEPQTLVEALVAQRAEFSGARPFMGIGYSGIVRPEHADHLCLSAYCGAGANRALADAGVLDICPYPYSQLAGLIRQSRIRADVAAGFRPTAIRIERTHLHDRGAATCRGHARVLAPNRDSVGRHRRNR